MKDVPITPPSTSGRGRTDSKKAVQVWNGVKIVRAQSFIEPVKAIARWSKEIDVTRVGIVGDMHSGKSTLAMAIAHVFHEEMADKYKLPFAIDLVGKEELLDFPSYSKRLDPNTNHTVIFDDASFLEGQADRKKMAAVKQAITTIRHLAEGKDVKILLMYNYHYSLGLDKYLRQTDFQFWTSAGSSEDSNMERLLHDKRAMALIKTFRRQRKAGINKGKWTSKYGREGWLTYAWRNPFIPVLFWDNDRMRPIVTPTREWLSPKCPVCNLAHKTETPDMTAAEFVKTAKKSFGNSHFLTALKLVLLENGLPTYSRGALAAKRGLEQALRAKSVSLEDLMIECNMKIEKGRLRQGFSKFLEAVNVEQQDGRAIVPGGHDAADDLADKAAAALPDPAAPQKTPAPPRIA